MVLEVYFCVFLGLLFMLIEFVSVDNDLEEDDEDEENEEEEGIGEEYIFDDGWGVEDGFVSDSEDEFVSMFFIFYYI